MEREFLFNYDALDNYLNEQQKSPDWTNWELTMFRDNCKKYLTKTANNLKEFVISINERNWDIIINWQKNLENIFQTLPTWYEMSNKARLYRQVISALEEAKYREIFDKIFTETPKKLNDLKEEIEIWN